MDVLWLVYNISSRLIILSFCKRVRISAHSGQQIDLYFKERKVYMAAFGLQLPNIVVLDVKT